MFFFRIFFFHSLHLPLVYLSTLLEGELIPLKFRCVVNKALCRIVAPTVNVSGDKKNTFATSTIDFAFYWVQQVIEAAYGRHLSLKHAPYANGVK